VGPQIAFYINHRPHTTTIAKEWIFAPEATVSNFVFLRWQRQWHRYPCSYILSPLFDAIFSGAFFSLETLSPCFVVLVQVRLEIRGTGVHTALMQPCCCTTTAVIPSPPLLSIEFFACLTRRGSSLSFTPHSALPPLYVHTFSIPLPTHARNRWKFTRDNFRLLCGHMFAHRHLGHMS
jgi:hypothetical protein